MIADFDLLDNLTTEKKLKVGNTKLNPLPQIIIEAEEWKVNAQGKVELVASVDSNLTTSGFYVPSCPLLGLLSSK